jgi:mono/diheme cytochrome c family protein
MIRRIPRLNLRWMALALPLLGGELAAATGWRAQLEPMFEAHCLNCHDADERKGGLDLSVLPWNPADAGNQQLWTKLFDQVEKDEMPP